MKRTKHTSAVVGANVKRLRASRRMTIRDLASQLRSVGVPMSSSGVTDIEQGRRSVSVDQLTALATILDVSPATLLTPYLENPGDAAVLSACVPTSARNIWLWMIGERSLVDDVLDDYERETFRRFAQPKWVWGSR